MYKGKYSRERRRRPALWAALALALVLTLTAGGTLAYLVSNTGAVTNTFTPANTKIEIDEPGWNGTTKSSILVKNTGDINVYVRVMLVASYQNADGVVCGTHTAAEPTFTLGTDWVKIGDYYYYKKAVPAEQSTGNLLGTSITLTKDPDHDDYVMHIDVLAQAIQAEPDSAIQDAWGVTIANGTVTAVTNPTN